MKKCYTNNTSHFKLFSLLSWSVLTRMDSIFWVPSSNFFFNEAVFRSHRFSFDTFCCSSLLKLSDHPEEKAIYSTKHQKQKKRSNFEPLVSDPTCCQPRLRGKAPGKYKTSSNELWAPLATWGDLSPLFHSSCAWHRRQSLSFQTEGIMLTPLWGCTIFSLWTQVT